MWRRGGAPKPPASWPTFGRRLLLREPEPPGLPRRRHL